MDLFVYLNGQIVKSSEAKISVFDRGFLYGDGIFESLRTVSTKIIALKEHYDRLIISANELNYKLKISIDDLEEIILKLVKKNKITNAYIRITITRGEGKLGYGSQLGNNQTIFIYAKEHEAINENFYKQGVSVICAKTRRNAPEAINPNIKSISNLNSLMGRMEAIEANCLEVIMLNSKGIVCEGSASNIFWVKDNRLFTPDISTGLLEGVTRKLIMKLAEEKLELSVIAGEYRIQDLKFADEVFLTSTTLEVLPVIQIDEFVVSKRQIGNISKKLREELQRYYTES
jgi:branched-chain amino acid aminotransferase